MKNVGIIGGSGFAGEELIRYLSVREDTSILAVSSRELRGKRTSEIVENTELFFVDPEDDIFFDCDVVFFATPHGVSMNRANSFLEKNIKVIDLSADFRLKDSKIWRDWYKSEHKDLDNLSSSIYGLTELNSELIKTSNLVAVPGCYPSASILGLMPLMKLDNNIESITIDAKSGISGAGRSTVESGLKEYIEENFYAYATSGHRHLPEISQILEEIYGEPLALNFLPHLIPAMRGIYATMYVNFTKLPEQNILEIYKNFYKDSPNIILMDIDQVPEIAKVSFTNKCQIGVYPSTISNQLVIISSIDNLVKGAAGQAIECYNLMCGHNQMKGLTNG